MKESENIDVREFLEETNLLNGEHYQILQDLREIVFKIFPKTKERMMYGGIMFSLEDDFGGIFARKNHISFEFGSGHKMNDPKKLLEGTGKFRRHLKIRSVSDIENKDAEYFIMQAY